MRRLPKISQNVRLKEDSQNVPLEESEKTVKDNNLIEYKEKENIPKTVRVAYSTSGKPSDNILVKSLSPVKH